MVWKITSSQERPQQFYSMTVWNMYIQQDAELPVWNLWFQLTAKAQMATLSILLL